MSCVNFVSRMGLLLMEGNLWGHYSDCLLQGGLFSALGQERCGCLLPNLEISKDGVSLNFLGGPMPYCATPQLEVPLRS